MSESTRALLKKAEQGDAQSQFLAGLVYENGLGFERDKDQALAWYRKAAAQGHREAKEKLDKLTVPLPEAAASQQKQQKTYEELLREFKERWGGTGKSPEKEKQSSRKTYSHRPCLSIFCGVTPPENTGLSMFCGWTSSTNPEPIFITPLPKQRFQQSERGLTMREALEEIQEKYSETYSEETLERMAQSAFALAKMSLSGIDPEGNPIGKNDFAAFDYMLFAAEYGIADAQNNLAKLYVQGIGIEKDDDKAFEWFLKAAESGNAQAMHNIGAFYFNTFKKPQIAFDWYLKAAQAGHISSQFVIGQMYLEGICVQRDYKQAFDWFLKAANAGAAEAQAWLGMEYLYGVNVRQDFMKSIEWHTKAAKAGFAGSQAVLGGLYLEGKGVQQNLEQAKFWLRQAADQGAEPAIRALRMIDPEY